MRARWAPVLAPLAICAGLAVAAFAVFDLLLPAIDRAMSDADASGTGLAWNTPDYIGLAGILGIGLPVGLLGLGVVIAAARVRRGGGPKGGDGGGAGTPPPV